MDNILPSNEIVQKTIEALAQNGISASVVETAAEAKEKTLSLIPHGSEVMTMTSITLEQTGIADEINSSGNYTSVRTKMMSMDKSTQGLEMQKLGAAPEYSIGSVHAVTQDGRVMIASGTGSQLPGYAYGSPHVIWIVSTKKIVLNIDEGMKRIEEEIVPKESVRARKAYGLPDSWHTSVKKLLLVNKEVTEGRIHLIFVHEDLGF